MFGKKKKDIETQEKDRQKNIVEPKYKIKLYKTLGRDVPVCINSFIATQKKDASGSMTLVSEDNNFKEPLAISKNEHIQKLKDRLELKNLPLEEQKALLEKKINKQEERIRSILAGKIGEEKVNQIEEDKLLKQLKVLRYVINHSEDGSYDAVDQDGYRERYYLYDEGALIPMFWDRKTVSLYVATDTAIKFYKADQDLIDQDYIDENRNKWASIGKGLMLILFVILFLFNVYWAMQNNNTANEIASAIENSNFAECVSTISRTNERVLTVNDRLYNLLSEDTKKIINEVNTDLS